MLHSAHAEEVIYVSKPTAAALSASEVLRDATAESVTLKQDEFSLEVPAAYSLISKVPLGSPADTASAAGSAVVLGKAATVDAIDSAVTTFSLRFYRLSVAKKATSPSSPAVTSSMTLDQREAHLKAKPEPGRQIRWVVYHTVKWLLIENSERQGQGKHITAYAQFKGLEFSMNASFALSDEAEVMQIFEKMRLL